MEPVSTAIGIKAALTAAAKSAAVNAFANSVKGVFGDTATDRERKASAADALAKALDGDAYWLAWLMARGDVRPDEMLVKTAPKGAQHIFRTALRRYYLATRQMPPEDVVRRLWPSGVPSDLLADHQVPGSTGGLSPSGTSISPRVGTVLQAGMGNNALMWALAIGLGLAALSRRGGLR